MCCIVLRKAYIFVLSMKERKVDGTDKQHQPHTHQSKHQLPSFRLSIIIKTQTQWTLKTPPARCVKESWNFACCRWFARVRPTLVISSKKMKAANFQLLEGTLYPLLTRLKNAGMVTYRWVESSGGPPRKYFSLTETGLRFYQELEATWAEMVNAVKSVIEPSYTPTQL